MHASEQLVCSCCCFSGSCALHVVFSHRACNTKSVGLTLFFARPVKIVMLCGCCIVHLKYLLYNSCHNPEGKSRPVQCASCKITLNFQHFNQWTTRSNGLSQWIRKCKCAAPSMVQFSKPELWVQLRWMIGAIMVWDLQYQLQWCAQPTYSTHSWARQSNHL